MNYKSYTLNNLKEIPQVEFMDRDQLYSMETVGNILPFKTNNYVTEQLIDWSAVPNDPMFALTFPQHGMLSKNHFKRAEAIWKYPKGSEIRESIVSKIRHELNPHPGGQVHNVPRMNGVKLNGVQHKYRETILFFPSQGQTCHAYCSFCFRWPQFTGMNQLKFMSNEIDQLTTYIERHKQVTDILFTGGDPLIMKTSILKRYILPLLDPKLSHLQTIRIGTKAIGYWPYRFLTDEDSGELLNLFEQIVKSGKNLSIMAHINHPVELSTAAAQESISKILSTGAQIRTQSPILHHINDHSSTWSELWRKQVNLNCIPYYMFIPRDTGAQKFFSVPLVKAWEIFQGAYQKVSGVCRTVRGPSMSCMPGKVQVLGVTEVQNEKIIALRMLQGRNPDWVARPFFAKYDPKALWINDLTPAFGEKEFFFEEELRGKYHEDLNQESGEDFE